VDLPVRELMSMDACFTTDFQPAGAHEREAGLPPAHDAEAVPPSPQPHGRHPENVRYRHLKTLTEEFPQVPGEEAVYLVRETCRQVAP
jgi:hypothetical protein